MRRLRASGALKLSINDAKTKASHAVGAGPGAKAGFSSSAVAPTHNAPATDWPGN
tara:strand:- start:396 stop:560 length:165 start_codon:yes stop_codon:yes gene_type:complete